MRISGTTASGMKRKFSHWAAAAAAISHLSDAAAAALRSLLFKPHDEGVGARTVTMKM
jgi:hypothetical protein